MAESGGIARLAVLVRQLQAAFGGRRPLGPYVAAFAGLAPGAAVAVQVNHNLGATDVEVVGAIRLTGAFGEACSWAYAVVNANRIDVWARNNGASAATFEVRLFIGPKP